MQRSQGGGRAELSLARPKQGPVYIGVLHNKTRLTEPHDHISNQI